MNISSIVEKITSDGHLPIGFFVFVVGSLIHVFHGLDASFVAFTTTVLGFLGGHAWVQSKTPEPPPHV
jgi:hypothetical protein